jgi:hydrogenase maturation protease
MNEWEWQLLEDMTVVDHIVVAGAEIRAGDRVRLRPRKGGDVLDIALAGQAATIESLEQDYEGNQHVCVGLDDDPGRDLGLLRQPGHRFFFIPEEIEPLPKDGSEPQVTAQKPSILIAGIGNIFLGDDGFGVEVVRCLAQCQLPPDVRVVDFGIRGFDLTYALQDGYETTILVDACPHGEQPGTVYVIEPKLEAAGSGTDQSMVDAHSMNPMNVIRLARAMNAPIKRMLLVGCEPETLGGEEGAMGLSVSVEAAVHVAVQQISSLVTRILDGTWEKQRTEGLLTTTATAEEAERGT